MNSARGAVFSRLKNAVFSELCRKATVSVISNSICTVANEILAEPRVPVGLRNITVWEAVQVARGTYWVYSGGRAPDGSPNPATM